MLATRAPAMAILLIALSVSSLAEAADAKATKGPIGVGDLAEYTSGFGPTVGEVVDGPDPSGYYVLNVPGSGPVPINGNKLRLVQRSGTPNAPNKAGDIVDLKSGNDPVQRARVVKVNGHFCQIEAPALVGWAECKGLRVVQRADGSKVPVPAEDKVKAAAAASAEKPSGAASAPSSLRGTYQNADGGVTIEFLPAGKAFFSFGGASLECTHRQSGKKLTLTCADDDTLFTVNDDGTLAGPPDSFVTRMKKKG